tara:strand:+ start:157 stop:585 length:429 start_codon:yes stop_codon:yes gene_type:complete
MFPLLPFLGVIKMLLDNVNFIPVNTIGIVMSAFGWTHSESQNYSISGESLTVVKPDFYPNGHVLAVSKKAVIICDGESHFEYRGKEYTDIQEIIGEFGIQIIETFPEWVFTIEKEWTIMKNGEFVHSFSSLNELRHRKKLRC